MVKLAWGGRLVTARTRCGLVALPRVTGFERDNWSPRGMGRRGLRQFRQLFGDAEQMLAPLHLAPDIGRLHTRTSPEHGQIIEQIGAFADDRFGIAIDRVDRDLDGFSAIFLAIFAVPRWYRRAVRETAGSRSLAARTARNNRSSESLMMSQDTRIPSPTS